ncbi:hypothetical protein [Haloechinothrix salitolerans]|uniref:Methyltransferase domain-containing protein n=1 Tax=Haloechinothrix salitolerans TaxID=926830 RepID=A0ABW2C6N2_9PSEU
MRPIVRWQPDRRYDVVFFEFWLSHVPAERFASFWSLVADCLVSDERVLFVDDAYRTTDELGPLREQPLCRAAPGRSGRTTSSAISTRSTVDSPTPPYRSIVGCLAGYEIENRSPMISRPAGNIWSRPFPSFGNPAGGTDPRSEHKTITDGGE